MLIKKNPPKHYHLMWPKLGALLYDFFCNFFPGISCVCVMYHTNHWIVVAIPNKIEQKLNTQSALLWIH